MQINNLKYLYDHLPARYRQHDEDLFLKRFLSWFSSELDAADEQIESFYLKINAGTAPSEFIEFWLSALFGWSWFPDWFSLDQRRVFYSHIAQHYARRGTAKGIELFLKDFGVRAKVHVRPVVWGEFTWGESLWAISEPLGFVVEIFPTASAAGEDTTFWDEFVWNESVISEPTAALKRVDVEELLRFQQPISQEIIIDYKQL